MVESSSDEILADADTKDIAFCVVGDPFSATTHTDLALRCRQHDPPIKTRTLPNASILTAVGATGLSLYAFGQTISMVFFTDTWKLDSFYGRDFVEPFANVAEAVTAPVVAAETKKSERKVKR